MLGFSSDRASGQRELEASFDSLLERENLRQWMETLSSRPHHVGSAYGKEVAELIASMFRSWGYDTQVEEFRILFPTPRTRVLEMVAPVRYVAALKEPVIAEDATSDQQDQQLPTYNAYSIDGDVSGELVYVNYGVPTDYEVLERHGVDVKGKVVIARYGGSWRGIKPKVAAEHGAVGCLLYSDPRDDGYYQGEDYPKGAYRSETGVQRGSVVDMPLYPGDPLTPGVGATADAPRLSLEEAPTLTKIPILPLSYQDALPLLKEIDGPLAPPDWRGALPLTYHIGPGPAKVHLKVDFNWDLVTAYNVIARLEGAEQPDQWIIRGNHHDAWVNGARDPVSGMVAVLEEARAVGELVKGGWKPKRTIVYAAWDAEEPGLLGSTEWVETHAGLLNRRAAVYINSDGNGRGFLRAGGSHTLEKFVNQVARDVVDPQKNIPVAERLRALRMIRGRPEEQETARKRSDLRIAALGSGSDYTPFLQHLGVASLNIGYGGEDRGGSYHSIYDSFDHYTRFGDPEFEYGLTLVKTGGRLVMRLADADILPFDFTSLADTVSMYVDELDELADKMRRDTKEHNRRVQERRYEAVADPLRVYVPPSVETPVPHVNLAPLRNALETLSDRAVDYDQALHRLRATAKTLTPAARGILNEVLFQSERALIRSQGLPNRSWFKHFLYAPGFYTGYGVKTMPAVREAIEQREWNSVEEQVKATASVLERMADGIRRATAIVEEGAAEAAH